MIKQRYRIFKAPEYEEWFDEQQDKIQALIDTRLDLIKFDGYFGDHKSVSDDDIIWELRWKSGRRIYYAYSPEDKIFLLLGGNKNGQNKDITKAKRIFANTTEMED